MSDPLNEIAKNLKPAAEQLVREAREKLLRKLREAKFRIELYDQVTGVLLHTYHFPAVPPMKHGDTLTFRFEFTVSP